MIDNLLERLLNVNEVNIPARLAADDLLSSFKEAYQGWEDIYKDRLSLEDFKLARKMIIDVFQQGFHVAVKEEGESK